MMFPSMRRTWRACFLTAAGWLIVSAAMAQTCVYSWSPVPDVGSTRPLFYGLDTGGTHRIQYRIPTLRFQTTPVLIRDLGFAVREGVVLYEFDRLTIRMGHTTNDPLLTTSFQANYNGAATTVLDARQHRWQVLGGRTPGWVGFGLQQPFQYLPGQGDLLLDIEMVAPRLTRIQSIWFGFYHGGGDYIRTDVTIPGLIVARGGAPSVRFCTDVAGWDTTGLGCPGSSGFTPTHGMTGTPRLGDTLTHWISSAPPQSLSFLLFGSDTTPPMPIDLGSMGMPGCLQYFPINNSATVLTDGVGLGGYATAVPNQPGLIGITLYSQYVCLDPLANSFGATTSNYGRAMVGY